VYEGVDSRANCVLSMFDADMSAWWKGDLNGLDGFLSGQIRVLKGRGYFISWTLRGGIDSKMTPLLKLAQQSRSPGSRI
jgi:hypothetical protein